MVDDIYDSLLYGTLMIKKIKPVNYHSLWACIC